MRDELGRAIKIMRHTRDFNRVDAEEVMAQAGMKDFHPKDDFLDMVKQYGYDVGIASDDATVLPFPASHAPRMHVLAFPTAWCSCSASPGH